MDKQHRQHRGDRPPGANLESRISLKSTLQERIEKLEARVSCLNIQITSLKGQVRFLVDLIKKDAGASISSIPH